TYAHQPGDRREEYTEDAFERVRKPTEPRNAMYRSEYAVHQGDQRNEGDQHGADVERQLEAVARPARSRINDIDAGLFHFQLHRTAGRRLAGFWHHHFGDHDGGGSRHDHGGEQVLDFNAGDFDVSSHYRARNVRHAARHDGEQFGLGEAGEERANGER